jgi:poly(A) polymerase Pap1
VLSASLCHLNANLSQINVFLRWEEARVVSPSDPLFLLPVPILRTLNAYRDCVAILSILPADMLPAFRLAHRALRYYCLQRGIFGSKLGYLSSMGLTIMLVLEAIRQGPSDTSASSLLYGFFKRYVSFPWETSEVSLPGFPSKSATRSKVSPMTILSPNKPQRNLAENVVHSTLTEISRQFAVGLQALDCYSSWEALFLENRSPDPATLFLKAHSKYIQVNIHSWGRDFRRGYSLVGYTESKLTNVSLN